MARQSGTRSKSRLRLGDPGTTTGSQEDEVVSDAVPSWHVWEYNPETDRTVYLHTVTRIIPGDNIYYLTPAQHQELVSGQVAGTEVDIERAKDST
jgi:hypothetical protein